MCVPHFWPCLSLSFPSSAAGAVWFSVASAQMAPPPPWLQRVPGYPAWRQQLERAFAYSDPPGGRSPKTDAVVALIAAAAAAAVCRAGNLPACLCVFPPRLTYIVAGWRGFGGRGSAGHRGL